MIVKATFDLDKGSVKIDVTDHVVNEYGVNIVLGASYFDMRAVPSNLQSCDKLGAVLPLFFRIKELKWQAGIGFVAVPENPELKSVGVDLLCNAYMAPWPPQPKKNVKPSTQ